MLEKHTKYFDILKISKLKTPTIDEIDHAYKEFIESISDFENAENAAAITLANEACNELKNWLLMENHSSKCEYQQMPETTETECKHFFIHILYSPSVLQSL